MNVRVIQVAPSRNARWQIQGNWEVFESDGGCCVHCGANSRESALSYAQRRSGYGHCEIQVLNDAWDVAEKITNEELRPLV